MAGERSRVLLVGDDVSARERYERLLESHDVRTAADADEATDHLDPDVDVVLVDCDAVDPSGQAVARRLAATGHNISTVLVGSRDPEFDPAEEPVDDFLRTPVGAADLRSAVETRRVGRAYETALAEFYAITVAVAALEATEPADALAEDEGYRRLQWIVDERRAEADVALARTAPDWERAFDSLKGRVGDRGRSSEP